MSSGSAPAGPSPEFRALVEGKITPEEYVASIRRRVNKEIEDEYGPRRRVRPARRSWWRRLLRVD